MKYELRVITGEEALEEERDELKKLLSIRDYDACISSFMEWLRGELKHNEDAYSDQEYALLEKVREVFFELIQNYNLDI